MKNEKRAGLVLLFILLFLFWMILASSMNAADLIIGAIASLLIVFYSIDIVFLESESMGLYPKVVWRLVMLFIVLMIEVVKANFAVVKIVLSPKININPGFKRIKQPLKKTLLQALFGNAITLTPGTLTVDMDEDSILVHGLNIENVDHIKDSPIEKAFLKVEGDKHD